MSVKLQFVLGRSLASRAIAWYGTSTGGYSHVDSVLPDGSLLGARSDVVGGQPKGVRIRPPGYERWIRRTVVELDCGPRQAKAWEAWLRKQIGKPYDQGSIWGFILGRGLHQPGHWICSACAEGALRAAGVLHPSPWHPSAVTPDALFFAVTAGAGGRVVESA